MPPKPKITKQDIINAGIEVVRSNGAGALNTRSVAAQLNCSTQPIFSNYEKMELLKEDIIKAAYEIYSRRIKREIECGKYPPYKSSGMAYIRFAGEEKELFRLLFMRDRTNESIPDGDISDITAMLQEVTGLDSQTATLMHLEMWVCVHGIAAMLATSYLQWDEQTISTILTDVFEGLKIRFKDAR